MRKFYSCHLEIGGFCVHNNIETFYLTLKIIVEGNRRIVIEIDSDNL